ncbi:MAG: hypothetical protein ACI311_01695 [Bacilli bacterium]
MEENENVLVEKKERKYTIYSIVVFVLSLVCFGFFVALILMPSLEFINSMKHAEGAEGLGILAIMMIDIYLVPAFLVVVIMGLISLGISKKKQKKRLFDSIATLLAFALIVLAVVLFVVCTNAANTGSAS